MKVSHRPIFDLFPDSAAIADLRTGEKINRDHLLKRVNLAASQLYAQAIPRSEPVVIAHQEAVLVLIWMFACWATGNPAVIVNPNISREEKENVLKHTNARLWIDENWNPNENLPDKNPVSIRPLTPHDACLILLSSGTTGIPKAIVLSVHTIQTRLALNIVSIGEDTLSRSLCVLPIFFGHGLLGNCLTPLMAGGTLYLWDSPDIIEIADLAQKIDRQKITFMSSVPSFWRLATRASASPKKPVKTIHIGSAPLSRQQWNAICKWNKSENIFNMFGMTETANWISGGSYKNAKGRDGYVGKIWGGKFAIMDSSGDIKYSGRGEVLVNSPSIMIEYLHAPEKTKKAFIDGWFKTGDIGELTGGGELVLIGRLKSEINFAGIKIQAEEVEMLLERHPGIVEACAFGIADVISGEAVAAAIILKDNAAADFEEIKKWCRTRARREAVPARLFQVTEFPKNTRGKIVRSQVRDSLIATDQDNFLK